jgi:hypothetical protein
MSSLKIFAGAAIGICTFAAGIAAQAGQVSDVYTGLRNTALAMKPALAGAPASSLPSSPYAVITDVGVDNGTVTLVVTYDGNASIYLSNGGGFLGVAKNPKVREAAKGVVAAAGPALSAMQPAKDYSLPGHDDVNFYVLTAAGVLTARSSESDLRDTTKPLGHLYDAVQDVITKYRTSPDSAGGS